MRGEALTQRQHQVLEQIREHVQRCGVPPSRAELARSVGLAHPSAVNCHLGALQKKGWIHINRGMDRGIRLLREGAPVFDPEQLPAVAAGTPMLADDSKAILRVPDELAQQVHPRADFYLLVRGDSMDLAGYRSGDIVAVHRSPEPRDGDVVIARIGAEITLKCFHRPDDSRIELRPRSTNPEHRPIVIDEGTEDWEVVGVVVGAMTGAPSPSRAHQTVSQPTPSEHRPSRKGKTP